MVSLSKENFLKQIYKNEEIGDKFASASRLADELSVSNAAITDMSRKLSADGLVNHIPYKEISLTEKGKYVALKVIRKHRLWELFLMETLNLDWGEVHDEAENLEHHCSEFLVDKIDEYLGFPKVDPHGAPIPDKNGKIDYNPDILLLSEAEPGFNYKLSRVMDEDNEVINFLNNIGMSLNTMMLIKDRYKADNSSLLLFNGKEMLISKLITDKLFVEKTE